MKFTRRFYMLITFRRDLPFDPVAHSTPLIGGNKKQVDLSDSGSEISDEGYKTSDNAKLMTEMLNGSAPAADINKQIQNRTKHIGLRSRPGSTDEGT